MKWFATGAAWFVGLAMLFGAGQAVWADGGDHHGDHKVKAHHEKAHHDHHKAKASEEVSEACVPLTVVADNEAKAGEVEREARKHEKELAREAEDDDHARAHKEKAREHERRAREHDAHARELAKGRVPAGYVKCRTPGGVAGLMPVAASSVAVSKAYREIRGQ